MFRSNVVMLICVGG